MGSGGQNRQIRKARAKSKGGRIVTGRHRSGAVIIPDTMTGPQRRKMRKKRGPQLQIMNRKTARRQEKQAEAQRREISKKR